MSDLLELVGLACLAGAAFLVAGAAAFLLVAGVELLVVGYALDGSGFSFRKSMKSWLFRVLVRRRKAIRPRKAA